MPERSRQIILLAVAAISFAAMVALVATGVSMRRARRDLTFGIEELDTLLAGEAGTSESSVEESAAMIRWLAERARTAAEALRVLKRAHLLYERTDDAEPLADAASTLLQEFPANTTIAAIAAFSQVRSGRPRSALAIARERLETANPTVYAWALLSASEEPGESAGTGAVLLAGLAPSSPADDFERAWRATGDYRYALDSVLILLRERDLGGAADLAVRAGLAAEYPLLVAQVLLDSGRFRDAMSVLETRTAASRDALLLLADAYLYGGENESAREIYSAMLDTPSPPVESYLNLAWLAEDRDVAAELLRSAGDDHGAWELDRARALLGLGTERGRSLTERWADSAHEADARLVELQLDPELDRRGYAAELWLLLERYPTPDAYRFAAWYFATRSRTADLRIVLEQAAANTPADEPEPAWSLLYRGVLAAGEGDWKLATKRFESGFIRAPSWPAALNAALARYRTGDRDGGDDRMQDALLLARNTAGRRRASVLIAAARASRSEADARAYVSETLEIDPGLAEALLLAARLENTGGR